jgi:RNase adaptor protein for sRNA GlmZ degradation
MRDPMSNRGFKQKFADGRPGEVQKFVAEDPRYDAILDTVKFLAHTQLRSAAATGKWLTISIRDHHGKWIAPAVGELLADALTRDGYKVHVYHQDLFGGGM